MGLGIYDSYKNSIGFLYWNLILNLCIYVINIHLFFAWSQYFNPFLNFPTHPLGFKMKWRVPCSAKWRFFLSSVLHCGFDTTICHIRRMNILPFDLWSAWTKSVTTVSHFAIWSWCLTASFIVSVHSHFHLIHEVTSSRSQNVDHPHPARVTMSDLVRTLNIV